jgi:hypothetical protein
VSKAPPPPLPSPDDYLPLLGYDHVGEQRTPVSYTIPEDVKQRLNGAVRFAGDTGSIANVESQTDVVRVAAHKHVAVLEGKYNDGAPFPPPESSARGRGADYSGHWVKIGANIPVSLHRRILGAVQFVKDNDLTLIGASTNRFIAAALDAYLTELEHEHHNGKAFRDPRKRLPRGRTAGR